MRNALCALIKEREKEDEEAHLSLIQMLSALQVMPMVSLPGSEVGELVEVASPSKNKIIKGNG